MDLWILTLNLVIGIVYVLLASLKIWHNQSASVWAFRMFVGLCGLTHLAHFLRMVAVIPPIIEPLVGSACAVVSVVAFFMVVKNKHEVFAIGEPSDGCVND